MNLRVLDLGYEYQVTGGNECYHKENKLCKPSTFEDTVDMSLDSGLGQLKALVRLEALGFESWDGRVGKPKLRWMVDHWPRLDRMHGLQANRIEKLQCAEPDVSKDELREFAQLLKPSIVHASLFADKKYDHVT
ncbi:hypothetical protein CPC16_001701 [Podila verticillata]|nr:hypothetical protein CPC16_001701 [Podila verticillata]